jgi:hypothetical protein
MLLRRLTNSAATLLPSFMLVTTTHACLVAPGSGSDDLSSNHAAASDLGDILQQSMVEFPLSDESGNDVTVGRMVYGVSRSATGSLDFFYQFFNYSPESIGIKSVKLNGFSGVNTEVHTLAGWEEDLPIAAERSPDGSQIDFLFDDCLLTPGERTLTMVVQTDAQHYAEQGTVDLTPFLITPLSSSTTTSLAEAQLQAFAPAASHSPAIVPLPAPVWSSLAGLVVTMIYVIRHK